jgi:hypothetical protein
MKAVELFTPQMYVTCMGTGESAAQRLIVVKHLSRTGNVLIDNSSRGLTGVLAVLLNRNPYHFRGLGEPPDQSRLYLMESSKFEC